MEVISYDKNINKQKIADLAYRICGNANFPVEYQDVYNHLFSNPNAILKLLIDGDALAGFGVYEIYDLFLNDLDLSMLYLSGMVIDPMYQGKNISQIITRYAYEDAKCDLVSLRTQNIAMAKSLLGTFIKTKFAMPGQVDISLMESLRQTEPFKDLNEEGIIKNCYENQLYQHLEAIYNNFGITLEKNDALAVVVEPQRKRSRVAIHSSNAYRY